MKRLTGIKGWLSRAVPAGSSRAEHGSQHLEHLARPAMLYEYCNTVNRDIQAVFEYKTRDGPNSIHDMRR
ncbi:hypothetical protein Hypma_002903 [Hypsizygus marmoreus]|uniref:Uncharacterized protein n=1 Tax=Hypsizygus marmoreus TaxID=39966 RepID=A0A369J7M6_HYPMA|nr:hypothetical protein Hypma_002903 [Hypsizygus marmoreus]